MIPVRENSEVGIIYPDSSSLNMFNIYKWVMFIHIRHVATLSAANRTLNHRDELHERLLHALSPGKAKRQTLLNGCFTQQKLLDFMDI